MFSIFVLFFQKDGSVLERDLWCKNRTEKQRRINRFFSLLFCFIRAMNSRSISSVGRAINFDLVRISFAFERAQTIEKWRPMWSQLSLLLCCTYRIACWPGLVRRVIVTLCGVRVFSEWHCRRRTIMGNTYKSRQCQCHERDRVFSALFLSLLSFAFDFIYFSLFHLPNDLSVCTWCCHYVTMRPVCGDKKGRTYSFI